MMGSWMPWKGAAAVALAAVAAILWWRWSRKRRDRETRLRIQRRCTEIPATETIFVSVPSYRDVEAAATLHDLFERAACPFRVFVGVCQQNAPEDVDVLTGYRTMAASGRAYLDNVRIYAMPAAEARGPTYARHLIEANLYRSERYYMTIDSHTAFAQDWDVRVVETLHACRSSRPVVTTYPSNFLAFQRSRDVPSKQRPSFLCAKGFDERGMVQLEGPQFAKPPVRPFASLFWAACFSFTYGRVIAEVPYDPMCSYVFCGEEISMAARLWTHGWDLFSPVDMPVMHLWNRGYRPTFWEQLSPDSDRTAERREMESDGYRRLQALLGMRPAASVHPSVVDGVRRGERYGLGNARTLQQYEAYCGIRFAARQISGRARMGLAEGAPPEELIAKYGSMANYHFRRKQSSRD